MCFMVDTVQGVQNCKIWICKSFAKTQSYRINNQSLMKDILIFREHENGYKKHPCFFEFLNMSVIVTGERKWLKCPPNVNQLLAVWKIWGAVSCNKKSFYFLSNQRVSCPKMKWSEFFFSIQCTLHRIDRLECYWAKSKINFPKT